jgi:hypothetical protein
MSEQWGPTTGAPLSAHVAGTRGNHDYTMKRFKHPENAASFGGYGDLLFYVWVATCILIGPVIEAIHYVA